ncbi:hypothetical protein FB45DRAFT_1102588 [Roridomyces roridus]|uniref:Uncharacterized protein n=1 Tax=Roridomyces roridus TaxID=1738132 RepID=A0AAD7CGM7_9AGAR|nr:hypothetical protein FB45DRAFT_1102588 [Roridomyces roridus]
METWDLDGMKSVIGTRAFTTSQSAQAHLILFTRIFEIAQADTGIPCRFRHIHGDGFELWIADSHKGQSLGAGMFCQQLCANLGDIYCPIEPTRLLRTLNPYEQASRFLRYCTTHYVRNVDKIRPYITTKVRNAMLSLSSSQSHPDFEGALRTIENGGPKAKACLKDKISGNKCALPALYQPASLIPLEIWKSAPSTTNGNEQAHRNINRDGVNLTMLGAIMRGMQYDARAIGSLELYSTKGIYSRDQISTHFRRLQRSLNRHGLVQARVAARSATVEEPTAETSDSRVPTTRASQTRSKGGKKPLFSSLPLPASSHATDDGASHASWWNEAMDDDTPLLYGGALSFTTPDPFATPYVPAADSLDQYFNASHGAVYPFNPTSFATELVDDNAQYLHILPSHNTPAHFSPGPLMYSNREW